MIGIIDIGTGNIASVKNALELLDQFVFISANVTELQRATRYILPGVGNFGYVMHQLRKRKMISFLQSVFESDKPFLGICVGLQILFETSEESPTDRGLGLFQGENVRFQQGKIPQIGWNYIYPKKTSPYSAGYAYFVNSYYVTAMRKEIIQATSAYYVNFPVIIAQDQITAVQFHPEKSGPYGIAFLRRWLEC